MTYTIAIMILLHIIDDFILQRCAGLDQMKQKVWWIQKCIEAKGMKISTYKYRYDYIACLAIHALKWALVVTLPFYAIAIDNPVLYGSVVLENAVAHGVVDHLKANAFKLNLIQDQCIHLCQIVATAFILGV